MKIIPTLRWKNNALEVIDQRLLPCRLKYIRCRTAGDARRAIKDLAVRGAPAIGIAASYGVYLGIRRSKAKSPAAFLKELNRVSRYIASARPTARNLFWGLERINSAVKRAGHKNVKELKKMILKEARAVLMEDDDVCRRLGRHGARLIKKGSTILTHCNAGGLATAGYGTALGVIFAAGKKVKRVYVDETRPVLQGGRLTAWELARRGIRTTLICDNMAASLMSKGKIDAVIVGADRVAANGDVANKIGTYGLAIAAKFHKVPFYVAAPSSTFDLSVKSGKKIPIEERDGDEVRKINGKYVTVKDIDVWNPAFDVTPASLVTAIITEKGVVRR